MDPKWTKITQKGPKMNTKWTKITQRGPKMDPKWTQNGPKMDTKWTQNTSKIAKKSPKWTLWLKNSLPFSNEINCGPPLKFEMYQNLSNYA